MSNGKLPNRTKNPMCLNPPTKFNTAKKWKCQNEPEFSGSNSEVEESEDYSENHCTICHRNFLKEKNSSYSNNNRNERESAADAYFRLFPERTTFHGVRDCFHSRVGCPRFTWIVIIFVATLAALQGCYLIINEFIARPVVVSYFIQEAGKVYFSRIKNFIARLPLPDIVICPFNRFNRSYLNTLNVSDGLAQYLELSYTSPIQHSFQLPKYRFTLHHLDEYEAGDGFSYGLQIVIKIPKHLYNPGVNQMLNDGIAVKLAEPNRGVDHDLSFIPTGVHAIMPLTATKYEFMGMLRLYFSKDFIDDPPRYKCRQKVDNSYSRVWCFELCLMEKAEIKCNCSLAAASRPRNTEICTSKQFFRCFGPEVFHENTTLEMNAKFFVKNDEEWENLKQTIILEVYYTSLDYTMIKHMVAMTPSGFLAQLGGNGRSLKVVGFLGQISLWIGGSILSIIQLIIFLSSATYNAIRAFKSRRQKESIVLEANNDIAQNSYHEKSKDLLDPTTELNNHSTDIFV